MSEEDYRPISRAELRDRLEKAGLSPATIARLMDCARPALSLETTAAAEDSIPVGATKIGGRPDLPVGMAWPHRPAYATADRMAAGYMGEAARLHAEIGLAPPWMPEEEGRRFVAARAKAREQEIAETLAIMKAAGIDDLDMDALKPAHTAEDAAAFAKEMAVRADAVKGEFPLSFIGQFDLAALAEQPGFDPVLPRQGRLYLFYDLLILPASFEPGSAADFRVFHDDTPASGLARLALPERLAAVADYQGAILNAASVAPRPVITTIPTGDAAWRALAIADGDDANAYHEWLSSLGWPTDADSANHQLGGWPRAIQSGMQRQAQLAAHGIDAGRSEAYRSPDAEALLPHAVDWRLLLQFGRDDGVGNVLPGALYVLLRDTDLAARRFEKAWVVYEQD